MNLSLVATTDIVEELKRRYPLLLVAGSAQLDSQNNAEILFYHGPILSLIVLTDVLHNDLLCQYDESLDQAQDIP
mgnify:CR=1 FL=1